MVSTSCLPAVIAVSHNQDLLPIIASQIPHDPRLASVPYTGQNSMRKFLPPWGLSMHPALLLLIILLLHIYGIITVYVYNMLHCSNNYIRNVVENTVLWCNDKIWFSFGLNTTFNSFLINFELYILLYVISLFHSNKKIIYLYKIKYRYSVYRVIGKITAEVKTWSKISFNYKPVFSKVVLD